MASRHLNEEYFVIAEKTGTPIASAESKITAEKAADKAIVPTLSTAPNPTKARIRSTAFRYYIHDGIDLCRFQLLGELAEDDLAELEGCWRTARTILGSRKLLFDLRGLRTVDEAGRRWLAGMAAEGASYLPESFLRAGLAPEAARDPIRIGWFGRLLSFFRGSRVLSAESSTQAQ